MAFVVFNGVQIYVFRTHYRRFQLLLHSANNGYISFEKEAIFIPPVAISTKVVELLAQMSMQTFYCKSSLEPFWLFEITKLLYVLSII